jgi:hypothetical protein
VVTVPILDVTVDGTQVDLTAPFPLDPNQLLAVPDASAIDLTVVPRSVTPAGPA